MPTAVCGDDRVSLFRTPTATMVGANLMVCLENGIDRYPGGFHRILAGEERSVAGHGVAHNEKAKVFQAMRPLTPDDLVRGQYTGYRNEPDVAKDSDDVLRTAAFYRLVALGGGAVLSALRQIPS